MQSPAAVGIFFWNRKFQENIHSKQVLSGKFFTWNVKNLEFRIT